MPASPHRERVVNIVWFLAWALASSAWCLTAANQLSATFDEPIYITRGLESWRSGSHAGLLQLGTMPLPADLATLPLYIWEHWRGVPLAPATDLEPLLPIARAMTLSFWWILLAYGWLMGRQLAGSWGARLAIALLACEPTLLAHASLATTDIAITACLFAMVYHFQSSREAGWLWRVGLPGVWFGAVLLAKASGLVFGPLCMLVIELVRLVPTLSLNGGGFSGQARQLLSQCQQLLRPFVRDAIQIGVIGLAVAFVYCGSDWQPEASFVRWAKQLPDTTLGRTMVWTAEHLRIFSNAGEGLVRQVKHNIRGHGTYLMGQVAERSIWYYFPVLLTIKLTLPLLLLPLVLLVVQPRALTSWACWIALALLIFTLNCRVQIGIRLVLPLVAFTIVGLAGSATRACVALSSRPRLAYAMPVLIGLSVGWTAIASARVWPHALCYTNELWGGTSRGYLAVSDSNYDWGQGLKELAAWQRKHDVERLGIWYYGSDPTLFRMPWNDVKFHVIPIANVEEIRARVDGQYFAVSTTLLYGSLRTIIRPGAPASVESYDRVVTFLRSQEPVARTTTFLIYDFRGLRGNTLAGGER